jgi:WD40 repeat protein
VSAGRRVERLRRRNPAAVELALACAPAARVEPALLRLLRLLVPGADASAEADLWFSDLLVGRDLTAITLDPLVTEVLREELRRPERAALRDAAIAEIAAAHATAYWAVRLEERVHALDLTAPAGDASAAEEIDRLLLAALDRLAAEPRPQHIARWLLGAAGRLPAAVSERVTWRASAAAAGLHLDRQAPPAGLLTASESEAWLPRIATALPTVAVPVRLLDGAVLLGDDGPDAVTLPEVPDTHPLVLEVRWNDGARAASRRVRFRPGEPVHVETGTTTVGLVTLAGTTYELTTQDTPRAGRTFDHLKARLRPCLGRDDEVAGLLELLRSDHPADVWVAVTGRAGAGLDTVLVAVTDRLRAQGVAVVEHFYSGDPRTDDPVVVLRSCLAQLAALYPGMVGRHHVDRVADLPGLMPVFDEMGVLRAFDRRPLVMALAGDLAADGPSTWLRPFPFRPPRGVHYLVAGEVDPIVKARTVRLDPESDRRVCLAMVEHRRAALDRAFTRPLPPQGSPPQPSPQPTLSQHPPWWSPSSQPPSSQRPSQEGLVELADGLPARLDRLLGWIVARAPGTVTMAGLPPVLTARWPEFRRTLEERFGRHADIYLNVLRSAAGHNTWRDCQEVIAGVAWEPDLWEQFRQTAVAARLAEDTPTDDLVRLDPAVVAAVGGIGGTIGHELLRIGAPALDEAVFTASRTRLGAGVHHCLAYGSLDDALFQLRHPDVLVRRYTDDPTGLLDDLTTVTDFLTDVADDRDATGTGGRHREWAHEFATLRTELQTLLAERVAPADLTAALRDRLAARGQIPDRLAAGPALAPLRVRQVVPEDRMDEAPDVHPAPVLAVLPLPRQSSLPGVRDLDRPLVVTPAGVAPLGAVVAPGPAEPVLLGAVGGTDSGFVAWTADQVFVQNSLATSSIYTVASGLRPIGPPLDTPVDHAVVLPGAVAVAAADGTVTVIGHGATPPSVRHLPGHGVRVTALVGIPPAPVVTPTGERRNWPVLVASEDGALRLLDAGGQPVLLTGHRGSVRCLADRAESTEAGQVRAYSGGDDGCVLGWDPERSTVPLLRWQAHHAPITCLATVGSLVLAGAEDGQVMAWDASTGLATVVGRHAAAVVGVARLDDGAMTWADTVRFWAEPPRPEPVAELTGFPGGVRDVVVAGQWCVVLCGDRSVQRRLMPTLDAGDDHPEYACLTVLGDDVVLGLGTTVVRRAPHGRVTPMATPNPSGETSEHGPYTAAAPARDGVLIRGVTGVTAVVTAESSFLLPPAAVVAAHPDGPVVTAWGTELTARPGADAPAWTVDLAAPVTGLAVRPLLDGPRHSEPHYLAGMVTGDARLLTVTGSVDRTVPGDGSPVTAVALLADGSALVGTAAGHLFLWPADRSQNPVRFVHGLGAITAVTEVAGWVLTAAHDGRITLWDTRPLRPVHDVRVGAPVRALAVDPRPVADPGPTSASGPDAPILVAARDDHGRLWLLDLDPRPEFGPVDVDAHWETTADGLTVQLSTDRPVVCVAVAVAVDDTPAAVDNREAWPPLDPAGRFLVPRSTGRPITLRVDPPPGWDGELLRVELDLVSRLLPGFHRRHTLWAGPRQDRNPA